VSEREAYATSRTGSHDGCWNFVIAMGAALCPLDAVSSQQQWYFVIYYLFYAHMCGGGMLRPSFVPPAEVRWAREPDCSRYVHILG
jgi:hypothetical protein